jgi:3-dehydroquinate synthase
MTPPLCKKTLSLHGCTIMVGAEHGCIAHWVGDAAQVVVISSSNVAMWRSRIAPDYPCIEICDDEQHKTLAAIEKIIHELLRLHADRHTFILGIGGGIVCDIAGFAASVFMRGARFGFVPTTMLAQVDASVGGKNGVNFQGFKNIVGTIRQPEFIVCMVQTLQTLPQRMFAAGFAEIVKAAVIADPCLFEYLESNVHAALAQEHSVLEHIIFEAIKIKANIVAQDEREMGLRRKLNLGHTFGHAIENLTQMPHGEAVSIGMCMAAAIARRMGLLSAVDAAKIAALLQKMGLPTQTTISMDELLPAIFHDKKKHGTTIQLLLPCGIGRCEEYKIEINELTKLYKK